MPERKMITAAKPMLMIKGDCYDTPPLQAMFSKALADVHFEAYQRSIRCIQRVLSAALGRSS